VKYLISLLIFQEPITAIVYMEEDDKLLVASGNEIKALDVKNGYTLIDKKKDKKEVTYVC
jgi:hypothetical protein